MFCAGHVSGDGAAGARRAVPGLLRRLAHPGARHPLAQSAPGRLAAALQGAAGMAEMRFPDLGQTNVAGGLCHRRSRTQAGLVDTPKSCAHWHQLGSILQVQAVLWQGVLCTTGLGPVRHGASPLKARTCCRNEILCSAGRGGCGAQPGVAALGSACRLWAGGWATPAARARTGRLRTGAQGYSRKTDHMRGARQESGCSSRHLMC